MAVAIFGSPNTGKSVFVGLLYQAMEKYANLHKEEFRFYMIGESHQKIGEEVKNPMRSGYYPPATPKVSILDYQFLMEFRPKDITEWASTAYRYVRRDAPDVSLFPLVFTVYDISGEDVMDYSHTGEYASELKDVFSANFVIFLIDASRFTNEATGKRVQRLMTYDTDMSSLISFFGEHRRNDSVVPIFVLTKFDKMDREIWDSIPSMLEKEGCRDKKIKFDPQTFMQKYDRKVADAVGDCLLLNYMGETRASVFGSHVIGLDLDDSRFFFSWVEEYEGPDGKKMLKTIKPENASVQNVYPEHMFEAFIQYFREQSKISSDAHEKIVQDFYHSGEADRQ